MSRKLIITIVMLSLFITSVAGCSGGDKKTNGDLSALKSVDTKNLKEVTLTFYLPGAEESYVPDILKEVEKRSYNDIKAKIKFVYNITANSYEMEILGDLNSNENFDGLIIPDNGNAPESRFVEYAQNGYLKDLSGMIRKYAPNIYGRLTPEEINAASYDGKLLAVPNLLPKAKLLYAVVREDLRRKYKLPEINTFEDYENYLKTIKEKEKGFSVPGMTDFQENSLSLFANSFDYSIMDRSQQLVYKRDDPEKKVLAWEQTPEFTEALNKLTDWNKKGYMEWGQSYIFNQMKSGYTASILVHDYSPYYYNNTHGVAMAYQLYSDKKTDREYPVKGCIAFNAKSSNVERALMFMDWIQSSQENYDLFMYGAKGSGKNKNVKIVQWNGQNAFVNMQYERTLRTQNESDGKGYESSIERSSSYPSLTGFYPDYSQLSDEASYRTLYLQLMDQNLKDGFPLKENIDSDTIKSYNDGTINIIKVIQNQLNRWKPIKK